MSKVILRISAPSIPRNIVARLSMMGVSKNDLCQGIVIACEKAIAESIDDNDLCGKYATIKLANMLNIKLTPTGKEHIKRAIIKGLKHIDKQSLEAFRCAFNGIADKRIIVIGELHKTMVPDPVKSTIRWDSEKGYFHIDTDMICR